MSKGYATLNQGEDEEYELSRPANNMQAFYSEVSGIQDLIQDFNRKVAKVSELHGRSLSNIDSDANSSELDQAVEETSYLSSDIKQRIRNLQRSTRGVPGAQTRQPQIDLVKAKFIEAIQNYQQVEQQNKNKHRDRIERQYKIVKPDATTEEVKAVLDDPNGNGQVFSQAVMDGRYGSARATYQELKDRQQDLQRIERTMTELAQLVNDMSMLVEEQDDVINNIEDTANNVEMDTEKGQAYTAAATESARGARKKRWICLGISVAVVIVLIIILLMVLKPWEMKGSGSSPAPAATPSPSASAA